MGFNYGRCKTETIVGEISWLELKYTTSNGVHEISFADESRVWNMGIDILDSEELTQRYEFDDTKRWIGIHGIQSNSGIESLGIITMDPKCVPDNGVLQDKFKEPEPEPEKETEKETESET